jgi:capsular polysaccharide biosynthesis protein
VEKLEKRTPNMEDTLGLTDILGILHRRFRIVVAVVVVGVSLAGLLSYVVLPPIYQSVTYARIIASRAILQDTIDTLGLSETIKQLTDKTTVQVQGQTEIIAVRVRDESAVRAAIIANAIAKSFIAQLPTLVNRVENVSVIDRAVPAAEQISPRPILNMVVALVAALMLGVLLAFLADYFDDVVKTPDDVKKVFGLRVLAVVPDIGSEEEWYGNTH